MDAAEIFSAEFGTLPGLLRAHAEAQPHKAALIVEDEQLSYRALDALADRIAASLQRDGTRVPGNVSVCAATSLNYAALWPGVLRAGAAMAPIAPSCTGEQIAAMVRDSGAKHLFLDEGTAATLGSAREISGVKRIALDGSVAGIDFAKWLVPEGTVPRPVELAPDAPFNIIYSSGTTGVPKGIVHSNLMRWRQMAGAVRAGYADAVTLISTPLYSNTTLVSFLPTLAHGGTAVLMRKFEARRYLEFAERTRATHTMLVPVQYQRIMADPEFDRFDLTAFRFKTCTSAPFAAELKRDILDRWPGKLVEYYGLTEGGCSFQLVADEFPDKLHTVGRPMPGHEARLIDEEGREVAAGEVGEIVGRSGTMMKGYLGRDDKTSEMLWLDGEGRKFYRQGDVGRFDEDGFLILMDRRKDMIISGGFNIYPSDIEAELRKHERVADAAVVGVISEQWGETPVAFVVGDVAAGDLKKWVNERLGKTQRVADVVVTDDLPRSAIGKVLKRELRERYESRRTG